MDRVDIMDKKTAAYRLDLKSKYRFYWSIFFDLMDVSNRSRSFSATTLSKRKSHEPYMTRKVPTRMPEFQ